MHPKLLKALDVVDSAVYSGDTFAAPGIARDTFKQYLAAWCRELDMAEAAAVIEGDVTAYIDALE